MASLRLHIESRSFRDSNNREITLRGINCAADAKFPASPDLPSHVSDSFFDGDDVSFVNRPFSTADAPKHFARLRRYGYNTLRYIFTWEALEHAGPGQYDDAWVTHTIHVLRIAKSYGFYVFMDPHQDVWSRFTGGSGAPLWTLYAVGLDPTAFAATEAALVQNMWEDPAAFPKMIWATNYWRYACQVVFTLFFGGKDFAPRAILDGKNIQDYLQDRFIAACRYLAQRIHEAGDLEDAAVVGWESLNEPNKGLVGQQDLAIVPSEQKLRKGTSPSAWQAILLGSGRSCEVEVWDIGGMGPYKSGSQLVDPQGQVAWLTSGLDAKYGWKRDPGWRLGECIWAQHGVWDPQTDELKIGDYFAKNPRTGETIDHEAFTNTYFMDFYRKYKSVIRSVHPTAIMFCQPPVLEIPPSIKGTEDDDPNMVYAPHYYDGLTLMTKKWNRWWNVDVFGVLRGRYLSPAFAIKIGETAIRNCLRDQLAAIRQEGLDYMGEHPCVFTEIGIPFDMDEKYAYRTGDYSSQLRAMDANHFALEGSGTAGYTLWVYVVTNNHEWGDQWNGEDLSIYSVDDPPLPGSPSGESGSFDPAHPSYSQSRSAESRDSLVRPDNLKSALSTPSISRAPSESASITGRPPSAAAGAEATGLRAAEATVRPSPVLTSGTIHNHGFDLANAVFTLEVSDAVAPGEGGAPTEVFLPEFHFPRDRTEVDASSGRWTITVEDAGPATDADAGGGEGGGGTMQLLRWWHGTGEQWIIVKGVKRRVGMALGSPEEEEGYLDQCQQQTGRCTVM